MFFELLKWWYGSGWLGAWNNVGSSVKKVQLTFAIPVLVRNLFAPWKQIITVPGRSLDEKFRASIDNLVSRAVGFFIRLATLIAASAVITLSAVFGLAVAIVWPLLPLLLIYSLIRVITG